MTQILKVPTNGLATGKSQNIILILVAKQATLLLMPIQILFISTYDSHNMLLIQQMKIQIVSC